MKPESSLNLECVKLAVELASAVSGFGLEARIVMAPSSADHPAGLVLYVGENGNEPWSRAIRVKSTEELELLADIGSRTLDVVGTWRAKFSFSPLIIFHGNGDVLRTILQKDLHLNNRMVHAIVFPVKVPNPDGTAEAAKRQDAHPPKVDVPSMLSSEDGPPCLMPGDFAAMEVDSAEGDDHMIEHPLAIKDRDDDDDIGDGYF